MRGARPMASAAGPRAELRSLAPDLYAKLNSEAFDGVLPATMELRWNARLSRTAGRCMFFDDSKYGGGRIAEIELSPRVLDSPERLRTTLAHEMCHAAQWLVDGEARPPHGSAFWRWAKLVEQRVPDVAVTTRHRYEIYCRYRYTCSACGQEYGRHSRVDVRGRRCGACGGKLQLAGDFDRDGVKRSKSSRRQPIGFAAFVQANYASQRERWPNVTHGRIMQTLGRKWRRQPRSSSPAAADASRRSL